MGRNGSGKSSLSAAIMGHPAYTVKGGRILYQGEDLAELEPEERARRGIFLAFQYPVAIPGVSVHSLLRQALKAVRAAQGKPELGPRELRTLVKEKLQAFLSHKEEDKAGGKK